MRLPHVSTLCYWWAWSEGYKRRLRDHQIGIWPEIAERVRRDGAAEASDEAAVEQELQGARE